MRATLLHGPPGHPLHPPLTDIAIGAYTVAAVTGVLGALSVSEDAMGKAMWLALLAGLAGAVLSAVTGAAELLVVARDSPMFRRIVTHGLVMASGTVLFVLAAVFQYDGFHDGRVSGAGLVLTLAAYGVLGVGGYLGGALVFRDGMRVESDGAE